MKINSIAVQHHWQLAWPLIIANCTTPLLGLADAAIAGHLDSAKYLAAVTVGAELITLLFWSCGFLRMGTTGLVAQAQGRGDTQEGLQILGNALLMGFVLGCGLTVLGLLSIDWVLAYAKPDENIQPILTSYLTIRMFSAPATLMSYAIAGWLLGCGKTRMAVIIALLTNSVNIVFNYSFAIGLGLNSDGIAIGTVTAEVLGLLFGIYLLIKLQGAAVLRYLIEFHRQVLKRLLVVNAPLMIRTLALEIVFVCLTVFAARIGVDEAAAVGLILVLLSTAAFALDGFAFASEIEAGQSMGAKDRPRFRRGLQAGWQLTLFSALIFIVLIGIFKQPVLTALTPHQNVVNLTLMYIPHLQLLLAILAIAYWLDGVFIGLTRVMDMCIMMILATSLGWFGGLAIMGTSDINSLMKAFILFAAIRSVGLFCRLPAASRF